MHSPSIPERPQLPQPRCLLKDLDAQCKKHAGHELRVWGALALSVARLVAPVSADVPTDVDFEAVNTAPDGFDAPMASVGVGAP